MTHSRLPGATVAGQETRGERVYLIREALGTRRDPMPIPKFVELIHDTTGIVYDKSAISRMETGERKVSLEDIEVLAQVDPLKRGKVWLAGWDDENEGGQGAQRPTNTPVAPAPTKRTRPPLQQPEILETRWIRPGPKKKATPKRRPGGRSAVA